MSYAFHFVATSLLEFFHGAYSAILKRDFSLLPEVFCVLRAAPGSWLMLFQLLGSGHSPAPIGPLSPDAPGHQDEIYHDV